jgi:hypothetical protein
MLRAVGFVIVLWYVSHLFSGTFAAIDKAGVATFETLELTARVTQTELSR